MIGIYKITNLVNGKCYIGQSRYIQNRLRQHISESKLRRRNTPLYNAMAKYGLKNFSFSVIEECAIDALDDREIYWIGYYNSYHDGYNLTLGGAAQSKIDSDEISNIIALWNSGKSATSVAKETGHAISTIISILRSNNVYDTKKSRSSGRSKYKRPVVQYDLDGNKVASYDSITNASIVTGISGKLISKSATNKGASFKFQWRYQEEGSPGSAIHYKPTNKTKPICQYDLSGNFVCEYPSLHHAHVSTGLSKSNIVGACKGRKKTTGGYIWRYAYETKKKEAQKAKV